MDTLQRLAFLSVLSSQEEEMSIYLREVIDIRHWKESHHKKNVHLNHPHSNQVLFLGLRVTRPLPERTVNYAISHEC